MKNYISFQWPFVSCFCIYIFKVHNKGTEVWHWSYMLDICKRLDCSQVATINLLFMGRQMLHLVHVISHQFHLLHLLLLEETHRLPATLLIWIADRSNYGGCWWQFWPRCSLYGCINCWFPSHFTFRTIRKYFSEWDTAHCTCECPRIEGSRMI